MSRTSAQRSDTAVQVRQNETRVIDAAIEQNCAAIEENRTLLMRLGATPGNQRLVDELVCNMVRLAESCETVRRAQVAEYSARKALERGITIGQSRRRLRSVSS
jgi:hypothetical protein